MGVSERGPIMSKTLRYRSKNFAIYSDVFRSDVTGAIEEIEFVDQPQVVIAVPVLSTGELLLVEQWRPLLNQTILECPGGKVEQGEAVDDAIRREMSEEVGLLPARVEYMGRFFSSVGNSTEAIHCVVASGMQETERSAADTKKMILRRFSEEELMERIQQGILPDGKSHIALAYYFATRRRSRGPRGSADARGL